MLSIIYAATKAIDNQLNTIIESLREQDLLGDHMSLHLKGGKVKFTIMILRENTEWPTCSSSITSQFVTTNFIRLRISKVLAEKAEKGYTINAPSFLRNPELKHMGLRTDWGLIVFNSGGGVHMVSDVLTAIIFL